MPYIKEKEYMDGFTRKEGGKRKSIHKIHGVLLPDEGKDVQLLKNDDHLFLPKRTWSNYKKDRSLKRNFLSFVVILFFVTGLFVLYILYQGVSLGREIQFENTNKGSLLIDMKNLAVSLVTPNRETLLGEKDGRINILLLGRAGTHYPGRNLTDTVMVLSIDTKGKKVALLSLPRDLYVEIPDTSLFTKINSLYQYGMNNHEGVDPLRTAVENITGSAIHYFFILDFDGFEKIVDTLQGIPIDVTRDFYDPRYPGKNYSYETFEIKKGWQTLNGATALKYVRERHNDPEGDFGRAKRQQQVIQAIKEKAFSLGTFFNIVMINNMFNVLGESIETDMTINDMEQFLSLIKTLDTKNVTTFVVDAWKKESLLRVSHIDVSGISAFILVPRIGTWSEVHNVSNNIFHLEEIKIRKQKIKEENTSIELITNTENSLTAQEIRNYLIEEIGIKEVIITLIPLGNIKEKSMIQEGTNGKKPFSLDELLKRFSLERSDTAPQTNREEAVDFSLIIGNDLIQAFSTNQEVNSEFSEDDALSEVIPPQEKRTEKK